MKPIEYEPQSVTAARHVIRNQDPPKECFFEDLHHGTLWFTRREDVEACLLEDERLLLVALPNTGNLEQDEWIRTSLERGDNPTLSRHAIDEALRELFEKFRLRDSRQRSRLSKHEPVPSFPESALRRDGGPRQRLGRLGRR